jgi:uncharacterized protein
VDPNALAAATFGISLLAGVLGSLLGLGGAIIVVPALTLLFGVDITYAVGAAAVSAVATSCAAASSYVKERFTNIRVAMFLESGSAVGAVVGAIIAPLIAPRGLFIVFGVVLAGSAISVLKKQKAGADAAPPPPDRWSDALRLHAEYFDPAENKVIAYRTTRAAAGLAWMFVAGTVGGMLGIGSGALKVAAMDITMRMPIKASTSTSNLMIGVTAATTAAMFFARGHVDVRIAGPVAVGVMIGATAGSRLLGRMRSGALRVVFVIVMVWIAGQMLWKGLV